jgi:hypothetical protein
MLRCCDDALLPSCPSTLGIDIDIDIETIQAMSSCPRSSSQRWLLTHTNTRTNWHL